MTSPTGCRWERRAGRPVAGLSGATSAADNAAGAVVRSAIIRDERRREDDMVIMAAWVEVAGAARGPMERAGL
ncbi:hypothetical protein LBMAG47_18830 [Planctomycetia bacterium]|nr:hypothetical protein LBMAG47_18830 [Planctomycetia bacterium]